MADDPVTTSETPETAPPPPRRPRKALLVGLALGVAVAVGAGAVYGLSGFGRNPQPVACAPALDLAKRVAPLARGEVAAVAVADTPRSLQHLAFVDGTGTPRTLADWKGRTVLLNLWATWCVPCRKEMPALDALQRQAGSERFEVVAVNVDTRNPDKPRVWLKEVGIDGLAYYADPSGKVLRELGAFGLPTTVLVDPSGCTVATLAGPAEWASPDALALVRAALAR
ncbi:TlpA disulfide reductase family protein [Rhodoplanes sp. TEM]|uniref:TlpA disulfide reductase family protein n=1 Tax=Rhodoplanes tepidamans TaxID=200616 RepID=A0ABT5JA61_RHOTP|nr:MULTISPECIES: TlpA disulfide reductase family protein [Rhodoplanes]MDC7786542.1 TlpA disulfide reductase family protein [Rhodoplanes tepidamans]MDC7983120.1 TlpA disulfide reductase family protein [Rhodoplanes sp. TEM]